MKKEYLAFVRNPQEIPEQQEVEIVIKDLTPGRSKYDTRRVRAILSQFPEKLAGADTLWLRSLLGAPYPGPWAIKIVRELEAYVPGEPYQLYDAVTIPGK